MSGPNRRTSSGQHDAIEFLESVAHCGENHSQLPEHARRLRTLAREEERHCLAGPRSGLASKTTPRGSSRRGGPPRSLSRASFNLSRKSS